jgi:hypothetical protein
MNLLIKIPYNKIASSPEFVLNPLRGLSFLWNLNPDILCRG